MVDSTLSLHQATDDAAQSGDFWTALRHAADILTADPHDHRARLKLSLSLAALGHTEAATETLRVGARDLLRRGFLLSALGMARDALTLDPAASETMELLRELHGAGEGTQDLDGPRMPPPIPPSVRVQDRPHQASSRDTLLGMAETLGRTPPPPLAPIEPRPLPLFHEISEGAFLELVPTLDFVKLATGREVVREGEASDALYVVVRGEVEVERQGQVLAHLGAGAFFGEMSLLIRKPRRATVRTRMPTELFRIDPKRVESLAERFSDFGRGLAQFARRRLLGTVVTTSPMFKPLDARDRRELLKSFRPVTVEQGQVLIRQGDQTEGLYVVVEGQFEVAQLRDSEPVVLAYLETGDVFGEIGLLRKTEATATVTASERGVALFLPRDGFDAALARNPKAKEVLDALSEARLAELHRSDEAIDAEGLILW